MHLVPEHDETSAATPVVTEPRRRRRAAQVVGVAALAALALGGCQGEVSNGFLPKAVSEGGQRVTDLWVGSWIAVLLVGILTWGLMLYAAVRFRKRKGDETLPVQLRYNVPMELLYTVIPVFMVAVFFWYTARDEAALVSTNAKPDVTISVVAKQWSWDFNYIDSNVHETGVHTELDGTEGKRAQMPVLYLPVNKRVEFVLNARDVTAACDAYALGAILFRAASGEHVYGDLSQGKLVREKLLTDAPPLRTGRTAAVARGLERFVARALARLALRDRARATADALDEPTVDDAEALPFELVPRDAFAEVSPDELLDEDTTPTAAMRPEARTAPPVAPAPVRAARVARPPGGVVAAALLAVVVGGMCLRTALRSTGRPAAPELAPTYFLRK